MQAVGILAQGSIAVLLCRKARAVCLDRKDVDGASRWPTSRSNTCGYTYGICSEQRPAGWTAWAAAAERLETSESRLSFGGDGGAEKGERAAAGFAGAVQEKPGDGAPRGEPRRE